MTAPAMSDDARLDALVLAVCAPSTMTLDALEWLTRGLSETAVDGVLRNARSIPARLTGETDAARAASVLAQNLDITQRLADWMKAPQNSDTAIALRAEIEAMNNGEARDLALLTMDWNTLKTPGDARPRIDRAELKTHGNALAADTDYTPAAPELGEDCDLSLSNEIGAQMEEACGLATSLRIVLEQSPDGPDSHYGPMSALIDSLDRLLDQVSGTIERAELSAAFDHLANAQPEPEPQVASTDNPRAAQEAIARAIAASDAINNLPDDVSDDAYKAAETAMSEAWGRAITTPATSVAGVRAKLEAGLAEFKPEPHEEKYHAISFIRAASADLEALTGDDDQIAELYDKWLDAEAHANETGISDEERDHRTNDPLAIAARIKPLRPASLLALAHKIAALIPAQIGDPELSENFLRRDAERILTVSDEKERREAS